MTCKDCLHDDACSKHCESQNDEGCCHCNLQACIYENNAEKCPLFTDKSRFVELPTPRLPLVLDRIGTDVYCPTCGGNLSGGWPDSSPDCEWPLYQCFYCGQSIDDTKAVTREAAEAAINKKEEEND